MRETLCVFCWDYVNWHSQEPFGCCTMLRISILTEQMCATLRERKRRGVFVLVKGVFNTDIGKLIVVSLWRTYSTCMHQLVLNNQIDTVSSENSWPECSRLWHRLGHTAVLFLSCLRSEYFPLYHINCRHKRLPVHSQ